MPAIAWILGAVGIGAAGGYYAGVKTSDMILAAALLAGGYFLIKKAS